MFSSSREEATKVIVRCEFAVTQEGEDLRSAADLTSFGDRVGLAEVEILRTDLFCVLLRLLLGQFDCVVKRPSAPQGNPLLERFAFPAGPSEQTAHAEPLKLIVGHAIHPVSAGRRRSTRKFVAASTGWRASRPQTMTRRSGAPSRAPPAG